MKTILETARLRLREIEESDLDSLVALDSDPEVMRYISDGRTYERHEIEQAIPRVRAYYEKNPGLGIWLAEKKDTGQFIGWACLKHLDTSDLIEVGYRLMQESWNQGFATEATEALLEYGWNDLRLECIVAITHPDNKASQRVLEKCRFEPNGFREFYGSRCRFFELYRSDTNAKV